MLNLDFDPKKKNVESCAHKYTHIQSMMLMEPFFSSLIRQIPTFSTISHTEYYKIGMLTITKLNKEFKQKRKYI